MTSQPIEGRQPPAVPRHARVDVIGGALIVLLAVAVWLGAAELDAGALSRIGTGALPKGLAVVLCAAGIIILMKGLLQSNETAERFFVAVRPMAIVIASIVVFGLFIRGVNFGWFSTPQLGLMIVGPVTVFIAGSATPEMNVRQLIVLSIGLTAAMLLVFMDLLSVTIPVFPKFIQDPLTLSLGIDTLVRVAYLAYGALAALLYIIFFGWPERRRD
ncbi:MAG: tripartite tricarboxylate transporter TctB family protein [Pseudolabrys sp.]|nr:tripartite tricarboxylate transporter TctB family protein [Pseudolabrys sp.]